MSPQSSLGMTSLRLKRSRSLHRWLIIAVAASAVLAAFQSAFVQGLGIVPSVSALQMRGALTTRHVTGASRDGGEMFVGVSPNVITPLMHAAHEGDVTAVKEIIASGADVNAQDRSGWTALRFSTRMGHYDATAALIEAGADVNIASKTGRTPLMSAAAHTLENLCELLVRSGAHLTARDSSGHTAFDHAKRGVGSENIRKLVATD